MLIHDAVTMLVALRIPPGMIWTVTLTALVTLLVAAPILILTLHEHGLAPPAVARFVPAPPRLGYRTTESGEVVPAGPTILDRLIEAADVAINRRARSGGDVAVVIIELTQPQAASAATALSVAEIAAVVMRRLRSWLPAQDTLARLGATRFAVLAEGLPIGGADPQTARIAAMLAEPINGNGRSAVVGFTIGAATADGTITDGQALVKAAANAHSHAVADAAEQDNDATVWRCYEKALDAATLLDEGSVADLRAAILAQELQAAYRPIVRLQHSEGESDATIALEAAALWRDQDEQVLTAHEFSAMARTVALGSMACRQVMEHALDAAATWHSSQQLPGRLALSVEPELLRDTDFLATLMGNLTRRGLPATSLVLGVDASLGGTDADHLRPALTQLRGQGVEVYLTGWDSDAAHPSDRALMHSLAISGIALHRRWAPALTIDPAGVRATVDAAHEAGLRALIEGIANSDQLEAARQLGIDAASGPAIGRAEPVETALQRNAVFAHTTTYS